MAAGLTDLTLDGDHRGLLTDLYQLTMLVAHRRREQLHGAPARGCFELFVRDTGPRRRFLVAAGIEQALAHALELELTTDDVDHLRRVPAFADVDDELLDGLVGLRFTGDVDAVPEGTVVFGGEPLLRVTGPIGEAQLLETFLLSVVNAQTGIATKAARVRMAAGDRSIADFGARRAFGFGAAMALARAAWIGGFDATSNVEAGRRLGIPVTGTLAHSFVMSFDEEAAAFDVFRDVFGPAATLLVDTYDTVRGVDRAIASGPDLPGIRLDSGDLGALAHVARERLDAAGQHDARIVASGDLDEHAIAALLAAGAPIDAFGVGTQLALVADQPSLGAVYKLVAVDVGDGWEGTLKLSGSKATRPGAKQVHRVLADDGTLDHDVVDLASADPPPGSTPLLAPYVRDGALVAEADLDLDRARARCREQLALLPPTLRELGHLDDSDTVSPVRVGAALAELTARVRDEVD